MNIFKSFSLFREKVSNQAHDDIVINGRIEYSKELIDSYVNHTLIGEHIAKAIADEIKPLVKDKLMEDSNFQKVINEVRLLVAKDFIESK